MATVSEDTTIAQSPAARPEDLGVTPWYVDNCRQRSGQEMTCTGLADRGSFPSYSHTGREPFDRPEANSTRNSSIESEIPRGRQSGVYRKAYMDLTDAIALLDETCPNQDASPSVTPKTPRTPVTPFPQNKRARSKSSDNSSNYSIDRLSDRSVDTSKISDKEKRRPFLKKIGLSKTEDRPFLAKLAPKIVGKPYLEKIGPSKAVERPFLNRIGSSRTLDLPPPVKFTYDMGRTTKSGKRRTEKDDGFTLVEAIRGPEFTVASRRSGKGFLLKMYSFETEDLAEASDQIGMHRNPLRGATAEKVLESGPSSLPTNVNKDAQTLENDWERSTDNVAELVKCRVTSSEEIISFTTHSTTPRGINNWENSPMRKLKSRRSVTAPKSPPLREYIAYSSATGPTHETSSHSPMKSPVSEIASDARDTPDNHSNSGISFTAAPRRISEDSSTRPNGNRESWCVSDADKQAKFEKRGISSDNLLSKSSVGSLATGGLQTVSGIADTQEALSEDSLVSHLSQRYIDREQLKQEHNPDVLCQVPDETYAAFKRRTRRYYWAMEKQYLLSGRVDRSPTRSLAEFDRDFTLGNRLEMIKSRTSTGWGAAEKEKKAIGPKSVLRKQKGIDQLGDQEADVNASLRQRQMSHEPSQETIDLLTEVDKTKSLLKTTAYEKGNELDKNDQRLPKKILLTDKEFCLSIERENSVRRPTRTINVPVLDANLMPKMEDNKSMENHKKGNVGPSAVHVGTVGPALFEKKCLSLDYADEEKPQRSEIRVVSLACSKNLPSKSEGTVGYTSLTLLCDSTSDCPDTFDVPSEEVKSGLVIVGKKQMGNLNDDDVEKVRSSDVKGVRSTGSQKKEPTEVTDWIQDQLDLEQSKITSHHDYSEVDIAIPIDQKSGDSSLKRIHMQERTSDLYEILSPRSTPFRVKKRLGKISVEETVKAESFSLDSKLDCRAVTVQKRTKCFPL